VPRSRDSSPRSSARLSAAADKPPRGSWSDLRPSAGRSRLGRKRWRSGPAFRSWTIPSRKSISWRLAANGSRDDDRRRLVSSEPRAATDAGRQATARPGASEVRAFDQPGSSQRRFSASSRDSGRNHPARRATLVRTGWLGADLLKGRQSMNWIRANRGWTMILAVVLALLVAFFWIWT
jgi:hypothetical protein